MRRRARGAVRWWAEEQGQAFIEFALLLPILSFLMVGGSDLARAYAMQLAVQNGARAGAEAAAIGYDLTYDDIKGHVEDEMNRTPGMDATTAVVNVSYPTSGGANYVRVEVQYTYRTIVAWPLLPNTASFDRATQFRTFP
ncbi:MAG: pilus assembly protein [Chloroflexota bacterium]|nr:pilus assembly protein [Chloroflexota bacterium]MDE3194078.1 pilus assembly protein [Chloroflexota bacterium]